MKHPKLAVMVIAFVLAALVLSVSGCELDGEVKEYRDPATLIQVEKGEEFAVVLASNPTTGYQWKLAEPLESEIVVLVKTEYEAPDTELLGAGGEEKWTFMAEGLGHTSITLSYVRPWEEGGEEEPLLGEEEEEAETGEEEQAPEPEQEAGGEEIAEDEGPTTVTFDVRVRKAGSMDKEPKVYDNPEEEIEVEAGLEFAIALVSNPSTGYSWQLAEPLDESVVELVSSEFEKKKVEGEEGEEGEIVGAPGEEVWVFEAISEGEVEIEFEYVRSWETDVAPEETKTFKVKVTAVEEGEGGH
ncbi:MAG: protease inhibitor I42 family protein [Actinomycetota bacterium]|nr:protease inhibitor I42 family protein [Actinomycetota bacterium]